MAVMMQGFYWDGAIKEDKKEAGSKTSRRRDG